MNHAKYDTYRKLIEHFGWNAWEVHQWFQAHRIKISLDEVKQDLKELRGK